MQTVYIVVRTLTIDVDTVIGTREIEVMPIIEGVFNSYEAANDFVDPLLDYRAPSIQYAIIAREVQ